MSLTASVVVLVVLLARILLRRAPRWCSYALWSVVLFRLLCPVSVGSALSLLNVAHATVSAGTGRITMVNFAGGLPQPDRIADVPPAVTAVPSAGPVAQNVGASVDWLSVLAYVWAGVALAMLVWALVSYLSLRVRLWDSRKLEGRVYVSRRIDTAFVAGFVLPKIYLPANLTERERECVLAHERQHIRRCDHIIKPVAFIALCLHWFNPLVWLSWVLSMHDMESSCDEAALRRLGPGSRADYAQTLLNMATGHSVSLAVSLSFGDDTKRRIKEIAMMKSKKKWVAIASAVLCLAVIAGCGANPATDPTPASTPEPGAETTPPASSPEPMGEWESVNEYVLSIARSAETIEYTNANLETATANVLDAHIAVDPFGSAGTASVNGLDPNGTLELTHYSIYYQLDVSPDDVMLAGNMRMDDRNSVGGKTWMCFEPNRWVYALSYPDGTCDILYDKLDGFMGSDGRYAGLWSQQIYDWYVTENDLDLPLCLDDWTDRLDNAGPSVYLNVKRCDGDGWYIYAPMNEWYQTDVGAHYMRWESAYVPEAVLTVTRIDEDEDITVDPLAGYELLWDTYQGDGCAWLVTATWPQDASVPEYAAPIGETMRLLFESFTVDPDFAFDYNAMFFNTTTVVYHGDGWRLTIPTDWRWQPTGEEGNWWCFSSHDGSDNLSITYEYGEEAFFEDTTYERGSYRRLEHCIYDGVRNWTLIAQWNDYPSNDGTLDAMLESFALD